MNKFFTLLMAFMAVTAVYGREISGKVVGENAAPLDYVNVVLYRDSTYITGTVTDQAGMFSIPTDVAGSLTAKCSFVGHETAVVGISAGPSFVQGLKEVGPMLFIIGALATSLPLLLGLILARYVFKFHPALSLGCTAGARTTTAALGAIQEAVGSETPSLGYTVTYAVGNTLLIIWGVVIVLLIN